MKGSLNPWTFSLGVALTAALVAGQSAGVALAQGDTQRVPSWADASHAPRHRTQADWLLEAGWRTADELFPTPPPREYRPGDREYFVPLGSFSGKRAPFVLRHVTEHAYFWFEPRQTVDPDALREAGEFFEQRIWRLNQALYGDGLNTSERLHIVHQDTLWSGVMGAFNPDDQCPRTLCPESNQQPMLYISLNLSPLGSTTYLSTLAHEHQHLIQHMVDGNEARWLNEGFSQLAEHLNGFAPLAIAGSAMTEFLSDPDLPLPRWSFAPARVSRHYGASYLFAVYLYERFGLDFIRALALSPDDGLTAVEKTLLEWGEPGGVDALFADWLVANLLDTPFAADGRFYYQTVDLPATIQPRRLAGSGSTALAAADLVHQYGADYLLLDTPGHYRLRFQGSQQAAVLDTAPASGSWMWWSNAYNSSAARLTGAFDLTGLERATLEFSAWWDVEDEYDWFQVLVSDSGGARWAILGGDQALADSGKAPGAYYSGYSGQWQRESIDLSAYAGRRVLIRFEYLTDSSENLPGVALDDITIRELGYFDDVEDRHAVWHPEGFLRVPRAVPQNWTVALVQPQPDGTIAVERMPIDARAAGAAEVTVAPGRPLTVVVGAMAAFSEALAMYELRAERLD